jgi:AcrR family transcriptional regulator
MVTSSAQRPRRTQEQRRDTARTAILETGIQLLADGGYGRMTLADLGERAGYSRSLATHYFGSKPKLLAAIIEHIRTDSPPPTMGPEMRGLDRIEAELAGVFDGLARNPSRIRAYIVIAHEAATSVPELRQAIHEQNVAFRQRVETALREGIDLGTVPPDVDAISVSIAVTAMVRGIAWEWFTDTTLDLTTCKQAVLDQARALFSAS